MSLVMKVDGFEEQLRESMKSAPWLGVSALVHLVAIVVLSQFDYARGMDEERVGIVATQPAEDVELLPRPPPPPPDVVPIEPKTIERVEDPRPVEINPSEFPTDTPLDGPPSPIRGPIDTRFPNDVIGVGPGGLGGGNGPGGWPAGSGRPPPKDSQISVGNGLTWLRKHQDPAGFWDCDGFPSRCEQNLCDGKGGALNDVGATALATLAFLGAGNTITTGADRNVVRSALRWMQSVQDADDGCVGTKAGQHFMYGHALATLALVEGFHLSRVPNLRAPAQRALDFVSRARNPYAAWRYAYPPDGDNDVSVTGWMLFALFAGRDAGLQVDDGAIAQGMNWVRSMADPVTGRTGYHEKGSPPAREPDAMDRWPAERSESMTACALLLDCFDGADSASADAARRADLVLAQRPRWDESAGSIDYYFWYYGSYAMWQVGGRPWDQWQKALLDTVVNHQRKEACELGSWDPQVDPWGREGGRVYSTAINVLSLQVYYRHAQLFGSR
jgi:hypothetical protein